MASTSLQEQFDKAAVKAREINGVSKDNKLQIYCLFKQSTEGAIADDKPRPGFFDQVGRAKYDAWAALGDLSKDDAKQKYVTLVESL